VGVPFQEFSYERHQYNVLLGRAQRFEILLGRPGFDMEDLDEEDPSAEDGEVTEHQEADRNLAGAAPPALPPILAASFAVDLQASTRGSHPGRELS
jgi:hypothetical protein